jgi:hypothetical protein
MTTASTPPASAARGATPPPTARRRRANYGLRSLVLLLAVTAVCVFSGLIASRAAARFDVTVTRQHRLSPRTMDLLASLDPGAGAFEVIIAADPRTLDAPTWQRTTDVLDALAHASRAVSITVLNTGTAAGVERYEALMARLAERFAPRFAAAAAAVESAAAAAERLAESLERLSDSLLALQGSLEATSHPDAAIPRDEAAKARVKAADLRDAARAARATLAGRAGPVPAPPTDRAAGDLRDHLADAAGLAANIGSGLRALATPGRLPDGAAASLGPMTVEADTLRDRAARQVAALDAVEHPALLRAARALEQNAAALVLAPPGLDSGPGVTAIDLDSILPLRQPAAAGPVPDIRFRAEDLITAAIASLRGQSNPIVVFVHAFPAPLGPEFRAFSVLMDRLALRGMSIAEWAVASEPDPPSPARLDPGGKRPIIYVLLPISAETPEAAARMGRLSGAAERLLGAGVPMLVSTVPSSLPATGSPDPMVAFLSPFGLAVDSGRPLLRQVPTPTGRVVLPDHNAEASTTDHPIAGAVRGLRTRLLWSCPISLAAPPPTGTTAVPILVLPPSPDLWAEADWIGFAQVWGRQPPGSDLPDPSSSRDLRSTNDPWVVAAAAERVLPNRTAPQRLVVVSGYRWFEDRIASLVSPQSDPGAAAGVLRTVGNLELFEAAALWLAGQDDLIARSAAAQSVALIPPLSPAQVAALRWALIAGLPVLVLMAGVTWRLLNG